MEKIITHSKWHDELDIFYQIKHGIILEGNIRDTYLYSEDMDDSTLSLSLTQYLTKFFVKRGYSSVVCYDHLDGFRCHSNLSENNTLDTFIQIIGDDIKVNSGRIKAEFSDSDTGAPQIIRKAVCQSKKPVVVIMDLVSRYIESPEDLTEENNRAFTILQQAIVGARDALGPEGSLRNIVVFIVNKKNDMPAWMFLDFQQVKGIKIEYPNSYVRRQYLSDANLKHFFDEKVYLEDSPTYKEQEKEWKRIVDKFIARTEGFSNNELQQLQKLCRIRKIRMRDLCSVVDLYIYGIQENPWENPELNQSLQNGRTELTRRVKGQDYAIDKTLDVIRRSVTGLSKIRNSSGLSPKGILFFAGPTGTGKTETAKALAQLVFGDESACIRFDMSEYRQDNSDQRLMGAPPGYVGYEAGGQLTNAVKDNPFSILLFDEIEKASPSILDKFLQILDDGRMTDGQGNTVYFNDCIIIFTSNLGMYTIDPQTGIRIPNVEPDMTYDDVQSKIRSAIEEHFERGLGKPELLNRIGENIVVFDFIREDAAKDILEMRLTKIINTIREEKGIELGIADEARAVLYHESFGNLKFGGRGINNKIESLLINPLARHIFEESPEPGAKYRVDKIMIDSSPIDIVWTKQ